MVHYGGAIGPGFDEGSGGCHKGQRIVFGRHRLEPLVMRMYGFARLGTQERRALNGGSRICGCEGGR
jgi:hypothetical protein